MSTELATPTPEAAPSRPDDLTPAELAYMNSRGEDTSFVSEGNPAPAAPAKPAEAPANQTQQPSTDEADGEITIDANGTARNSLTGQFVPKSAYLRLKDEAKTAKSEAQELRDRTTRADERLKVLSEALGLGPKIEQRQPEPEAPIDPEKDIFGAYRQLANKFGTLEKQLTETRQTTQAERDNRELANKYHSAAAEFAKAQPAFGEAYVWLMGLRDRQLESRGYTDKAERGRLIAAEEMAVVREADAKKLSAPEAIYKYAVASGFVPKAGGVGEPTQQPAPATNSAADKLANIERGQQASRSLTQTGGGTPAVLTIDAINAMPQHEFNALLDRLGGSKGFQKYIER